MLIQKVDAVADILETDLKQKDFDVCKPVQEMLPATRQTINLINTPPADHPKVANSGTRESVEAG